MNARIGDRIQPMAELTVQIVEVAESPAEEEVLPDIAERALDLALGLGPIGPPGGWFATGMIRFARSTGIGPVEVQKPKARDRAAASGERLRFSSNILPKWARRTKSLDALLPVLYLRGISAGDFQEALAALLGKDAPNLSAAVIARLKSEWEDEYRRWQKRDLSARHYVYVWADGVYLQARMEPQAECMLVLMGATAEGKKELIGFQTGMRESGQSWKELLVDLKVRGLVVAPQVAIGDGALGFWKALDEAFPTTRHQRCWLRKALQVLVDDEAAPDQPAVTEHHREEPDDALDPWLVGELDVELGEVDLRLLAGRRLEAHFESGGADGAKVARAIAHDAVAAGEAALLDLSPPAYGGQAGIGRQTLAQIGLEGSTIGAGVRFLYAGGSKPFAM